MHTDCIFIKYPCLLDVHILFHFTESLYSWKSLYSSLGPSLVVSSIWCPFNVAVPWPLLLSKCNIVILCNLYFVSLAELSWLPACVLHDFSFVCFFKATLFPLLDKSKMLFCSTILIKWVKWCSFPLSLSIWVAWSFSIADWLLLKV